MHIRFLLSLVHAVAPAALLCLASSTALAATLTGSVKTRAGDVAIDARVLLLELDRATFVAEDGSFRFDDVADGHYHVSVESARFGRSVEELDVSGDTRLDVVLGVSAHSEAVVVSAGTRRGDFELYKPIEVLDRVDIARALQPTIGETLAKQPGVQATSFAPGASRPIIRGQGGGRIRVLENGLDVGDASTTSPDHAVAVDPATADGIEIVRGPATLLYGSAAVGGAVNVLDSRVPEYLPRHDVEGSVDLRYGSNAEDRSGSLALDGGLGAFAWNVQASGRETEDFEIPGRAVEDDPDSPEGTLPNSALESSTLSVGGSWVGDAGFVGAAVRTFDTRYGIPAELEEEEPAAAIGPGPGAPMPAAIGGEGVSIDLEQRRLDVRGAYKHDFGPFREVRAALGRTDYQHVELEGGEVGTRFLNDSTDLRIELPYGATERSGGILGVQLTRRDFEAIGAEAFVPPSETDALALFALQEFTRGDVAYELGLRYENQRVSAEQNPSRSFDGLSASGGIVWRFAEHWSLGGSIAQAVRLPSAEELYSNGPHLATLSYEIGNPDLREETSLGADLRLRRREGRLTGELNLFYNDYRDFIYELATGEVEDGLPVFRFTQGDADFYGYEFLGVVSILHRPGHDLDFEIRSDRVRATLAQDDMPLPFIPADRYGAALRYRGNRWYASAEVLRTEDQDRVATGELPTAGYALVDASVGYRFLTGRLLHDVMLRGTNLTDELARPHTSRLKRFVPLPGRDVAVSYRLVF